MRLEAREDIAAPLDQVWRAVTNFTGFERSALRRGVDVVRVDRNPHDGVGATWDLGFRYRGRDRRARCQIVDLDEPLSYAVATRSGGIEALAVIEVVPLSRERTRLDMGIDLSANTLSAKLLLQSMRLARGSLGNRLKTRVARFAQEIEDNAGR